MRHLTHFINTHIRRTWRATAMAAALIASASSMAGGSLDLSLSNDAVRLGYDATKRGTGLHMAISGLYHVDRGGMFGAGVHVVDLSAPNSPIYVGVGARLMAITASDYVGMGLGIGGFLRYRFPALPELSVAPYLYYAPPVVTFMDAKGQSMLDTDLRLQYDIIPSARAYLGVRYSGTIEKNGATDDGVHLGVTLDF